MLPIGLPIYLLFLPFRAPAAAPSREGDVNGRTRVILIGVDGLGGEAVDRADCPNLRALMRRGAWTLKGVRKSRSLLGYPVASAPGENAATRQREASRMYGELRRTSGHG